MLKVVGTVFLLWSIVVECQGVDRKTSLSNDVIQYQLEQQSKEIEGLRAEIDRREKQSREDFQKRIELLSKDHDQVNWWLQHIAWIFTGLGIAIPTLIALIGSWRMKTRVDEQLKEQREIIQKENAVYKRKALKEFNHIVVAARRDLNIILDEAKGILNTIKIQENEVASVTNSVKTKAEDGLKMLETLEVQVSAIGNRITESERTKAVQIAKEISEDKSALPIERELAEGYELLYQDKHSQSIVKFNSLLLKYSNKLPLSKLASIYFALGYSHSELAYENGSLENYQKSIEFYTKVIDIEPNNSTAYNNRGFDYQQINRSDTSLNDYNRAISIDNKAPVYYVNRGNFWLYKENADLALQDFNEAIRLDPKTSFAYNGRAYAYIMSGEINLAEKDLQQAFKLNPLNLLNRFNIARYRMFSGNFKEINIYLNIPNGIKTSKTEIFVHELLVEILGIINGEIYDIQKSLNRIKGKINNPAGLIINMHIYIHLLNSQVSNSLSKDKKNLIRALVENLEKWLTTEEV